MNPAQATLGLNLYRDLALRDDICGNTFLWLMRALAPPENVSIAAEKPLNPKRKITSRPVSRVLSGGFPPRRPFVWDAHCWTPRATNPGGGSGNGPGATRCRARPAAPIWSCSRWGLPCRRRYRRRGALLPHPFTLASASRGGLLSVALSLGSPPAAVSRHRVSMEPGLSSTGFALMGHSRPQSRQRPSGRLVWGIRAHRAAPSRAIASAGDMT